MVVKKFIIAIFLPLLLTSLLLSQSLAELSKKEKERRESLKGKKVVVITNADLTKGARKPALDTPPPGSLPATGAPPEETYTPPPGPEEGLPPSPPAGELNPPPQDEFKTELESRWAKAKEYADLLETKMAALWQEFYSMDDMTPRDAIQREIADTFVKLEKAREEEARAKDELDQYVASIRKEQAPPLWIR